MPCGRGSGPVLLDLQRIFRATVTSADDILADRVNASRGPVSRRIAVYRNTVQKSLADVLAAAFPVTQRIVGVRFFHALATDFAVRHPPTVPQLSLYGAGFPDFIATHPQAQELPYLADVAWMEWARGEAYFAADALPLDPGALSAVPVEKLSEVKLFLHPAARLIRSFFPIFRIWSVNQPEILDVPAVDMHVSENVLISRPQYEVFVRKIAAADAAFLSCLMNSGTLGEATVAGLACDEAFNLQDALQEHFFKGTFASLG